MAQRRLPLLAEPEDVAGALRDEGVLIVDLSNRETHEAGHVPGAVHLAYADLVYQQPPAKGLLPDADTLARVLGRIGLTPQHHVVAYDDEGNGRASRLLWTLDALGHHDYSLLDGGLGAWTAEGRPLETGLATPEPTDYPATLANPDVVVDRAAVLERLGDDNTVILDARSPAEYRGDDVRAARGGHIPGAINLEWTQLMDAGNERRLHPPETLRTLLKQAGVTPDKAVITHCQTHHRSALTFFVLRYLGYPSISAYDGSWSDWGNATETPVVTGDSG